LLSISANAQGTIDKFYSKYKDVEGLHKFELNEEQLDFAKKISYNLNAEQKNLILQSKKQYTIIYKGNNPSRIQFYNELLSLLNTNGYLIASRSNDTESAVTTYAHIHNNKIDEVISVTLSGEVVSILVSKGDFDKNFYKDLQKPDQSQ